MLGRNKNKDDDAPPNGDIGAEGSVDEQDQGSAPETEGSTVVDAPGPEAGENPDEGGSDADASPEDDEMIIEEGEPEPEPLSDADAATVAKNERLLRGG